ncbi:hypothetical protein [Pseudodesulfovibrio piezophilus]|uniref:Uncharacterized protein n=1 Tax=Pseudodesulfovibrio piezophilus (strain DSM 21447 / JCM 15486 / C1TLV30) TaxID=1322246 RepID=M1WR07_PSEP2|nr:hypothetical protein [Pseudodesulfovibrio piezophilus]CCH48012.1 protein of unknown function [Pseudodesulfovibrio piezophilus C1TLV30]
MIKPKALVDVTNSTPFCVARMDFTTIPGKSLLDGLDSACHTSCGIFTEMASGPERRTEIFDKLSESKEKINFSTFAEEVELTRKADAGDAWNTPIRKASSMGQSGLLALFTVTSSSYAIVVQSDTNSSPLSSAFL